MKVLFLCGNLESLPSTAKWLIDMGVDVKALSEPLKAEAVDPYDIIISHGYRHIIKPDALGKINGIAVNLHISYLPYNRGADPNLWSIAENTPSGVSIHLIDEGLDTGHIVAQKTAAINDDSDTLATSYNMLQKELESLFIEAWPFIESGKINPFPQTGLGTYHSVADKKKLKGFLTDGWDTPVKKVRGCMESERKYRVIGIEKAAGRVE